MPQVVINIAILLNTVVKLLGVFDVKLNEFCSKLRNLARCLSKNSKTLIELPKAKG